MIFFVLPGVLLFGGIIYSLWIKYIIFKNPVPLSIEYEEISDNEEIPPPKYEDII